MKIVAVFVFAAVMTGLLFVWTVAPHSSAAQVGDYDSDDDGLIEIRVLEQLNAVRWDLDGNGEADSQANQDAYAAAFPNVLTRMGCPNSGCIGYELARDLDFDDPGSYASGVVNVKWTEGAGWLPIGVGSSQFRATLDGNGHTIANLYISRSGLTDPGEVGLFGQSHGSINLIGLTDVDISGGNSVGSLAGSNNSGTITASYATGSVSGNHAVGGLVGWNAVKISHSHFAGNVSGDRSVGGLTGFHTGEIRESYATGSVSGNEKIGGLIGNNDGSSLIIASYTTGSVSGDRYIGGLAGTNWGIIGASYATGSVSGNAHAVGGLVGENRNEGLIIASYATGSVFGQSSVGGLIGGNSHDATISDIYWDTQTSGQATGVGEGPSVGVAGKTTAELQAPVGYTGIYAGWLLDFDNADGDFDDTTGVDDFWDFGTASEYPALKADFDGDGTATWEEFGNQRGQSPAVGPTPLPVTPSPTPAPPGPTPVSGADLELTMLLSDYLGFLWYYVIVGNNGPSDATGVVLTDRFPEGISPLLSMPVTGTCSGERMVVCELGGLSVGSKTLVLILARPDGSSSQGVPVNSARVSAAGPDPYPANNVASR